MERQTSSEQHLRDGKRTLNTLRVRDGNTDPVLSNIYGMENGPRIRCVLIGSSSRRLQPRWFVSNSWLRYSTSKDSVYCGPCRFFGPQGGDSKEKAFGVSPINDWSNLGKLVTRHQALKSLQNTIILCGKQGLALRGHGEDDGNFVKLLEYRSKDNGLLRDHMLKKETTNKYTSPEIQNALIQICGEIIVGDIVRDCNKSPCFGFITDEATDCSTTEQMALCVRFYEVDKCITKEKFLGFAECGATTGKALTDKFLHNLTEKGIVIQNMRGQGYDGAANMSGKYRGVHARVREIIPDAVYTHCKVHSLNLCIIHACKEPLVRNVMDTIQTIAFAFDYSAKRLTAFNDALNNDELAKGEMDRRRKLKRCDCDLLVAVEESKVVKTMINQERNDQAVWDALFESAIYIAQHNDIEPSFPRVEQRQCHRSNKEADDPSSYWRKNMFLPFIDHLYTELDERLINAEPRYSAQYLLPKRLNQLSEALVDSVFDSYSRDLQLTKMMFHREVQRWRTRWVIVDDAQKPSDLSDTIRTAHQDLYPGIHKVLCVLVSMPVSTATAERSFSVMRRVKTYLRNTMTTSRLSGLGLLNVYREKILDSELVLDIFARRKNRKLALVFQ
ncbi:uncharacterized protein LOC128230746 [Mya arenaria]|uniref:uncharacterized protein LOC128230746 n=1 Tax=Mya arenaria TaxID=6604 RepID=UPI0022E41847|nr:uncharacterized protein LOC128230746 [Mya arenaria]